MEELQKLYEKFKYVGLNKLLLLAREHDIKVTRTDVQKFLEKQSPYQLHKRIETNQHNPIRTGAPQMVYQMDLVDMSKYKRKNSGYTFILIMIDVFSKKAAAFPLKSKSPEDVIDGVKDCFDELGKPKILYSDQGGEFKGAVGNYLDEEQIIHKTAEIGDHNVLGVIDRFTQTIKSMIYKHFTYANTTKYDDTLDDIIHAYNNTPHSGICNFTPEEADKHVGNIVRCMYARLQTTETKKKIPVGKYVRVMIDKGKFKKGYTQRWSTTAHKVESVDGLYYVLDNNERYRQHMLQQVENIDVKPNDEMIEANADAITKRLNHASGLDVNKETGNIEVNKHQIPETEKEKRRTRVDYKATHNNKASKPAEPVVAPAPEKPVEPVRKRKRTALKK